MTKSTSSFTLKRAALIAAIGTTIYTLFEPVCRMVVGDRWWLYFDDHMLYNDVWHIFFSSILIASCVVFAIGVLSDGEHFPILGKGIRYILFGIAIALCGNILWFALSDSRHIIDTVPWLNLFFLLGGRCGVVVHLYPCNGGYTTKPLSLAKKHLQNFHITGIVSIGKADTFHYMVCMAMHAIPRSPRVNVP